MPRYLTFTDNEDGTTTITTNMVDENEETTLLLPVPIDSFSKMMNSEDVKVIQDFARDSLIIIPNTVEE